MPSIGTHCSTKDGAQGRRMEFRRVEGRQRNCADTWETSNERLDSKRRSAAVVVRGAVRGHPGGQAEEQSGQKTWAERTGRKHLKGKGRTLNELLSQGYLAYRWGGGGGQNLAPEGVCGLNRDQGNCLTVATPAYGILSSSTTSLVLHVIIC